MSTQSQFGRLYQNVLKDRRLDHVDIRILAFLLSFAPGWRFIQTFVATELGLSLSSVARSVCRLDAAGYLTYDTKVRKSSPVRKNIRVQHQPSHWNPIEGAQPVAEARANSKSKKKQLSVSQAISDVSSVNGVNVTDDIQIVSQMTYDGETTKSSIVDLDTESYDVKAATASSKAEALSCGTNISSEELWKQVNVPLRSYIEVDPNQFDPADTAFVRRLVEDAQSMRQGLMLQDNEVGESGTTGRYWRDLAISTISDNVLSVILKPRYCVQILEDGYRLFKCPETSTTETKSRALEMTIGPNRSVMDVVERRDRRRLQDTPK